MMIPATCCGTRRVPERGIRSFRVVVQQMNCGRGQQVSCQRENHRKSLCTKHQSSLVRFVGPLAHRCNRHYYALPGKNGKSKAINRPRINGILGKCSTTMQTTRGTPGRSQVCIMGVSQAKSRPLPKIGIQAESSGDKLPVRPQ